MLRWVVSILLVFAVILSAQAQEKASDPCEPVRFLKRELR